ncbi:aldehyde-activating protein [Endozoicomonas sp. OPT23]|uniref:GFA family protein n=1 Tax=Endozoicomonas sp. OPT23 TaxID=2072845 RepID=UPI00129B0CEA|nr:aldehyde-activating protein [Endozoicomonas sp. OPT23]MRI32985.1 aldehyde-activating protein [Endozoicomonas sp. OPT23]
MQLSCHCENVKITVTPPSQVTECNCSICSRYMSLWGYYPPGEPRIEIGAAGISSYSWGDNELDFIRCSHCGCITHYETKPGQTNPKVAINFGMERKQVAEVPVRYFNGAELL